MRLRVLILPFILAVLLASVGTAVATTDEATAACATPEPCDDTRLPNETTEGDDGATVGVCVIGVDSPCNGDDYDDPREAPKGDDTPTVSDGLPLANDTEKCVPGPATMCAPVEEPTRPLPKPHYRAGDGSDGDLDDPDAVVIQPVCENDSDCARYSEPVEPVPEPSVVNEPVSADDIRCVRAPCELPAHDAPSVAERASAPSKSSFDGVFNFFEGLFGRFFR